MHSAVVLFVVVMVAGCQAAPRSAPRAPAPEPAAAAAAPVARAATRPHPASALHPDRVLAREVLAAIRRFTDEACACADAACLDDVQTRMGAWAAPRMRRIEQLTPTPEENAAAEALQVRMRSCLARVAPPVMPLTGTIVLTHLREFKDDICACRDKGCVTGVQEQMVAWAIDNLDAMKGLEPTPAEGAEAARIDAELDVCLERIDGASR